jgi:ABC-type transporter Mla maintaining outer membrane lipid asymmetry ATPase subunit MlaF
MGSQKQKRFFEPSDFDPDKDPIIELKGIRKRFGDLDVLKKINLRVHRGEVIVLIVPSQR